MSVLRRVLRFVYVFLFECALNDKVPPLAANLGGTFYREFQQCWDGSLTRLFLISLIAFEF